MPREKRKLSVATRVTISLVLLSVTSAMLAHSTSNHPTREELKLQRKTAICESLAISCSLLAERRDAKGIGQNLSAIISRNPDIDSVRLVRNDGRVMAEVGEHEHEWTDPDGDGNTAYHIRVPISNGGQSWGALEISFRHPTFWAWATLYDYPVALLLGTTLLLNSIFFRWYIGKILTYLNPSTAVPQHVRSTIDTFAEGIALLDTSNRIVLTNQSFANYVNLPIEDAVGRRLDDFPWHFESPDNRAPWHKSSVQVGCAGQPVKLTLPDQADRTFLVSVSPILDEGGQCRGMITSFDDITTMVQKREELRCMLTELQRNRDELTQRNHELQVLATRDPLTGCLNRRTFFELFDKHWNTAVRGGKPISCAMVDIDFFKSINDNHGHSTGDEVLRDVARALVAHVESHHIVCRYGGEEFCVLMPALDIDVAERVAERLRIAVSELKFPKLSVTTSIGVSALSLSASNPQELLEQADKCLYVAKRNGRNQVVRWDDVPEEMTIDEAKISRTDERLTTTDEDSIPYAAVASLLSALAYRHPDTAAHSSRVAELAVCTAHGLLTAKESYVLEIGALLHDIGKIGVPDSILLKPGPLTAEEWKVMHIHDRIGVEIIETSFRNPQLVDVLRYHHAMFGGSSDAPKMPRGENIPLSARIVAIADAYDAIVSDRVYRKGRSQAEAFAELRRCAGRQFDPVLVERFIGIVQGHHRLSLPVSSKQSALQIGSQIERLARAVDDQDIGGIVALASRLEATAAHCHIPAIQNLAASIKEAAAAGESETAEMIAMTFQLIDLCRSTQRIYTDTDTGTGTDMSGDGVTPAAISRDAPAPSPAALTRLPRG